MTKKENQPPREERRLSAFSCPYLHGEVEMSLEREEHIQSRHPDFLPEFKSKIAEVLANPDQIRKSNRFVNAKLFTRWFDDVRAGKFVVIVVVTDHAPNLRHWIITAYMARKIVEGEIEWNKN